MGVRTMSIEALDAERDDADRNWQREGSAHILGMSIKRWRELALVLVRSEVESAGDDAQCKLSYYRASARLFDASMAAYGFDGGAFSDAVVGQVVRAADLIDNDRKLTNRILGIMLADAATTALFYRVGSAQDGGS